MEKANLYNSIEKLCLVIMYCFLSIHYSVNRARRIYQGEVNYHTKTSVYCST